MNRILGRFATFELIVTAHSRFSTGNNVQLDEGPKHLPKKAALLRG